VGRIRYQKIRVSELVGNVPNRHIGSDETSGMNDWPQRNLADSEGQTVLSVRMNDCMHFRTCLVNGTVDESFDGWGPPVSNGLSFQAEFDQITPLDDLRWRQHMSHEEPLGVVRVANTDVAVSINDVFIGKDPVRNNKLVKGRFQSDHHFSPESLYRKDLLFLLFGDFFQFMDVIVRKLLNLGERLLFVVF
jgi:hypothetical protein